MKENSLYYSDMHFNALDKEKALTEQSVSAYPV